MIIQTFTQIFAVIASANEDKYAYLMFSLPYEHIHSSLVISLVFFWWTTVSVQVYVMLDITVLQTQVILLKESSNHCSWFTAIKKYLQ